MKIEVDENTALKFRGIHRDIAYEISGFRFSEERSSMWDMKASWATYVILTEEMHEKVKDKIDRAPWNGGQTFYRKITEEHIGVPADLAEKWNKPYYKVGDDFQHLWDMERQDLFYREFFERHIKKVIDYLLDGRNEED